MSEPQPFLVTVSKIFKAASPADAVMAMVAHLTEHAGDEGYSVTQGYKTLLNAKDLIKNGTARCVPHGTPGCTFCAYAREWAATWGNPEWAERPSARVPNEWEAAALAADDDDDDDPADDCPCCEPDDADDACAYGDPDCGCDGALSGEVNDREQDELDLAYQADLLRDADDLESLWLR